MAQKFMQRKIIDAILRADEKTVRLVYFFLFGRNAA